MKQNRSRIERVATAQGPQRGVIREELIADLIALLKDPMIEQFRNAEDLKNNPNAFSKQFRQNLSDVNKSASEKIKAAEQDNKAKKDDPLSQINNSREILKRQLLQNVLKEMDRRIKASPEPLLEKYQDLAFQARYLKHMTEPTKNVAYIATVNLDRSEKYFKSKLEVHINNVVKSMEKPKHEIQLMLDEATRNLVDIDKLRDKIVADYPSEQQHDNLDLLQQAKDHLNVAIAQLDVALKQRPEEEKIQDVELRTAPNRITQQHIQLDRRQSLRAQQQSSLGTTIDDMGRYAQSTREKLESNKSHRLSLIAQGESVLKAVTQQRNEANPSSQKTDEVSLTDSKKLK